MCLKNVNFAMEWSEELQQYVGYGYKKNHYWESDTNKWLGANGTRWGSLENANEAFGERDIRNITSAIGDEYPAGFHIFVNRTDAEQYSYVSGHVYKVAYTNPVAFGTNRLHQITSGRGEEVGEVIIAQYMWVFPLRTK